MSDKDDQSGAAPSKGRVSRTLLGLEQLLYACLGYAVAQLPVHLIFSDPEDADYIVFGIAGAVAGVLLHVLVRGMGVKIPGLHWLSPSGADGGNGPRGSGARYRGALAGLRRSGGEAKGRAEPPDNSDKTVKTENGFRVGDREFPNRSEAEDSLYVESASDREAERRRKRRSAPHQLPPVSAAKARLLNAFALAVVVAVIAVMAALSLL